ncbi:MAG: C39 family peptidase [Chloroflexi bacterium]|nr:C39 family peptidase [Chloroflexota bacterium]
MAFAVNKSQIRRSLVISGLLAAALALIYLGLTLDVSRPLPASATENMPAASPGISQGKLLDVPYLNQGSTNWCFYTSLAMVLQYHGKDVTPRDIAGAQGHGPERSLSLLDVTLGNVEKYVSRWTDLSVEHSVGTWGWADYRKQIDESKPVIASSFGLPGHAVVVTGYSAAGRYLYVHDPSGYLTRERWRAGGAVNARVDWDSFRSLSWYLVTIARS